MKKIILLPDTNFFIQCQEPTQLSWQEFSAYEEVELWLSRPVQLEIDAHKGKGSGRVSKRARTASTYIKKLIVSNGEYLPVRDNSPRVTLRLSSARPDPELADELDYNERDCQLVGVASTVAKSNAMDDVKILTQDIGPIASARSVGVGFFDIPDKWLLPQEKDESEKKLGALKAELDEYKKVEPRFDIKLQVNAECQEKITTNNLEYLELDDAQVEKLLDLLSARYPKVIDFKPDPRPDRKRSPYEIAVVTLAEPVYKDVSQRKKEQYFTKYDEWLQNAEKFFRKLHIELNYARKSAVVSVLIENSGIRPGTDSLVSFTCRGDFSLLPLDSWEDAKKNDKREILSRPPHAPKGEWLMSRHLLAMPEFDFSIPSIGLHSPIFSDHLLKPPNFIRDPGTFYWHPERPDKNVKEVSLTCAQWRHQSGWEEFDLTFNTPLVSGLHKGVLEIQVHAANLAKKVEKRYFVEIETEIISSFEWAKQIIEKLEE